MRPQHLGAFGRDTRDRGQGCSMPTDSQDSSQLLCDRSPQLPRPALAFSLTGSPDGPKIRPLSGQVLLPSGKRPPPRLPVQESPPAEFQDRARNLAILDRAQSLYGKRPRHPPPVAVSSPAEFRDPARIPLIADQVQSPCGKRPQLPLTSLAIRSAISPTAAKTRPPEDQALSPFGKRPQLPEPVLGSWLAGSPSRASIR